jgi:2-polyprenyl-6-methoxyphenol hydroxylase-like FAD-dependent oxidoreductase
VLRLGRRCVGFGQDDKGVVARFEDGGEERGDVLVGADGIRSTVREQLSFTRKKFNEDLTYDFLGCGARRSAHGESM